jgi:type III secretion protein U
MSDKSEQPTSKKLRDAREKGQVASSKDVSSTALLLGLFAYLKFAWDDLYQRCQNLIVLPADFYGEPFDEAYPAVLQAVLLEIVWMTVPALAVVIVFGVAANFFQTGALLVFEPVKPDLKKINPFEKAKQIVSIKNLVEFLKSCFKVCFLGYLLYIVMRDAIPARHEIPHGGLAAVESVLYQVLYEVAKYTALVYGLIAAVDLWFQRRQHVKGLMMSKDEVKREYKEMEGDPHIKSKRKHLHQEMVMSDSTERVKKATVLVTNPTHKAIAIFYEAGETKLPMITAMGEGYLAERMIKTAQEEGIPIMQNVPLATDLFEHGQIEQYIPTELITPIAEVLRWVQQLKASGQL